MGHGLTGRFGGTAAPPGERPGAWIIEAELGPKELRRVRTWLLIAGTLALIAGALSIALPALASLAIATFIGWLLIGVGILMAVHAFQMHSPPHMPLRLLTAALTLILGVLIVAFPDSATLTFTFLLSVWFFATGAMFLATWWQQRGLPGAGLAAFNGALSLLLGLLIAVDLPSSADWAIGLLVGVNLIFWGVRALIAANVLKRVLKA